jgi:hypothetical protein
MLRPPVESDHRVNKVIRVAVIVARIVATIFSAGFASYSTALSTFTASQVTAQQLTFAEPFCVAAATLGPGSTWDKCAEKVQASQSRSRNLHCWVGTRTKPIVSSEDV